MAVDRLYRYARRHRHARRIFEIITLKQLGQLNAPLIILNLDHYYDSLFAAMHDMEKAGFIHESVFSLCEIADSVEQTFEILDRDLAR
ncbi:LOG family protein [Allobaculum sp. Allo2]|nr:LOG family protein [Allobaculum sp. Allo2]